MTTWPLTKMSKKKRDEVRKLVRETIRDELKAMSEVWLTEEELLQNFQFLSKNWLRFYGDKLPRKKKRKLNPKTRKFSYTWLYKKDYLQRMIMTGRIQQLRVSKLVNR